MTVDRAPLLKAIGVDLPDDLLTLALTHRSYAYEAGGLPTNERLEFLGDAVLGLVITAEIFEKYPDRSEGELAKLKSAVVNTQALARIARNFTADGLGAYLLLGRGEVASGGAHKANLLADAVESLLGATYVHYGHEVARDVVIRLFSDASRDRRQPRAPASTGRPACRSSRPPADWASPSLRRQVQRPRPRQALHRGRAGRRRRRATAPARAAPRRRPSSKPPPRRTRHSTWWRPPESSESPELHARAECLSFPRSRSSGAGSTPTSSDGPSPRCG